MLRQDSGEGLSPPQDQQAPRGALFHVDTVFLRRLYVLFVIEHHNRRVHLALAGRAEPPLRVARLRAEGRILEIGPDELVLTATEASLLLRNAEVALGEDDVAELHRRTEGQAAGLYLAALYLGEGGRVAPAGDLPEPGRCRRQPGSLSYPSRASLMRWLAGPVGLDYSIALADRCELDVRPAGIIAS